MLDDILFVKGGGVSTRNYAKNVKPENDEIAGVEVSDGVLFVKGVDVVSRSPRSE